MEFEMIREAIPVERQKKSDIANAINNWLKSENKTLFIRCKSGEEVKKATISCYSYRKNHKEDFVIFKKDGSTVCLVRA